MIYYNLKKNKKIATISEDVEILELCAMLIGV